MAALDERTLGRWWADRSGRRIANLVLGLAAAAWLALLILPAGPMPGMAGRPWSESMELTASGGGGSMAHPGSAPGWSWTGLLLFTGLWALMMAAMMLPTAMPMIALYGTIARRQHPTSAGLRSAAFALPYAALWTVTGIPVYACAVAVGALVGSQPWAAKAGPYAVAATLLAAGLYQFTPLKRVCRTHCQSPLRFLTARWRPGWLGAARMGSVHAAYCCGCCAMLMIVLVVAGAMGLAWVLLIGAVVGLEKLSSRWPTSCGGAALIALGLAVVVSPSLVTSLRG